MGFKCGIVGLPNVGKSTLFNALTESNKAESANYPFATIKPNSGKVPVPDKRLSILSKINSSKKTIPTYIDFVDIAGLVKGSSTGEGLGNKFLSHIREVDAIAHIVRCFEDETIAHISHNINPINDIEIILTELRLADIESLQNKLKVLKIKAKDGDEKIKSQIDIIYSLLEKLNLEKKIILTNWSNNQQKFIKELNLIIMKPMLYICNVDEKSIVNGNNFSNLVKKRVQIEGFNSIIISASIEFQIAQFDKAKDKLDFLYDLGLEETSLNKVIRSGYNLLNLITFFTSTSKETRAWTVTKNTTAQEAAGKIHSDFAKGFIKAETITFDDLVKLKNENACREAGKLRQEGKDYIVRDADVFHFLFNV